MSQKSKFFRVAVSGNTIDGRVISPTDINDMAASYDPNVYGARIWLEHIRGLTADSAFNALGDVLELEARDIEINGKTERALYASIKPTAELLAINKKAQKIYSSIEIAPNFAKTNKAYMFGLAVTDSPASLGTEALQFFGSRKQSADNIFTPGLETAIEFENENESSDSFLKKFASLLTGSIAKTEPIVPATPTDQPVQGTDQFNALLLEIVQKMDAFAVQQSERDRSVMALSEKLNAMALPATPQTPKPAYAGNESSNVLTDC